MAMVNMKMSAEERKEYEPATVESSAPDYPYGLCIHLDDDALEKLGITSMPAVGTEVMVMAKAVVKGTSAYARNGEADHRSVELQITDMELGQSSAGGNAAATLYGNNG
jgi:hypothetical protein